MESIIGLYKTECVATVPLPHRAPTTIADVEYATAGWVDWYNHRRLHGYLGYHSPEEHEQAFYAHPSGPPPGDAANNQAA